MNVQVMLRSALLLTTLLLVNSQVGRAADEAPAAPIVGTKWTGQDDWGDEKRELVLIFHEDGTLEYTTPTGTFKNGTWKKHDNAVLLETNKFYSVYLGTIRDGKMSGIMNNKVGGKGTWSVKKVEPARE